MRIKPSCPSGFICFENISLILLMIGLLYLIYYLFAKNQSQNQTSFQYPPASSTSFFAWPNIPYTNLGIGANTYLNPMTPPLRDERFLMTTGIPTGPVVPINVPTNIGAVETNYRQLGIITPLNQSSKDSILPLMGKPLFTNRDKWNYYTISNQHNNVKLPVSKAGRSCTNEYGCDKLYDGDTVYVEGANEAYKVTIYENDVIRYLPFI
jgi:hypothetical protein